MCIYFPFVIFVVTIVRVFSDFVSRYTRQSSDQRTGEGGSECLSQATRGIAASRNGTVSAGRAYD